MPEAIVPGGPTRHTAHPDRSLIDTSTGGRSRRRVGRTVRRSRGGGSRCGRAQRGERSRSSTRRDRLLRRPPPRHVLVAAFREADRREVLALVRRQPVGRGRDVVLTVGEPPHGRQCVSRGGCARSVGLHLVDPSRRSSWNGTGSRTCVGRGLAQKVTRGPRRRRRARGTRGRCSRRRRRGRRSRRGRS